MERKEGRKEWREGGGREGEKKEGKERQIHPPPKKKFESSFPFLLIKKNRRGRKCCRVTYLWQIIYLLFCFLDPRHLGGGCHAGKWSLQLYRPLSETLTHSTAALMSASQIPLPNCLISWMVLSPHWLKLMVQNENPTLTAKSCLVWFSLGRRVCVGSCKGRGTGLRVRQRRALAPSFPVSTISLLPTSPSRRQRRIVNH